MNSSLDSGTQAVFLIKNGTINNLETEIFNYFVDYYNKKENTNYPKDNFHNYNVVNIFNYIIESYNLKNTVLHKNRNSTLLYKMYENNMTKEDIINYLNNSDDIMLFLNEKNYPYPLTIDDIFRGSEYFFHFVVSYDDFVLNTKNPTRINQNEQMYYDDLEQVGVIGMNIGHKNIFLGLLVENYLGLFLILILFIFIYFFFLRKKN